METEKFQQYERAVKYARGFREFYKHLVTFLIFVIILLIFKSRIIYVIGSPDPELLDWIHINLILIPIIWGGGVLMHGIYVYRRKFTFFKDWEQRKMKELMKENEEQNATRWE